MGTNKIGLVSYSTTLIDFTPLTNDTALLHSEIDTYQATDRTCISCGIAKGTDLLKVGANTERHMILLSDGKANHCISGGCVQIVAINEAIHKAEDAWQDFGIHIHTVAFTGASDNDTMIKIAEVGNGTFHYAEEENLTEVFLEIAQEITKSFPSDTSLDVGNNGVIEWTHPGAFMSTDQASFVNELNIIDCNCPSCTVSGNSCIIDMNLTSSTAGKLIADNLTIEGCVLTQLPSECESAGGTCSDVCVPENIVDKGCSSGKVCCSTPPSTTTTTLPGNQTTTTTILPPAEGHVVINEFVSDPVSGNSADEWIEIYNPTSSAVNINNWTITEAAGQVTALSGSLQSHEFFTVTNPNGILNNDGDKLTLKDNSNNVVDMVAYGNFNDSNTADNAPDAADPKSTGRKTDGLDTDVDSNDFKVFDCTTKNASNTDNCLPVAPTNLDINLVSGNVVVTWTASSSPDVAGYRVYTTGSVNGFSFAAPNATVNSTNYTDTTHLASKERYYIIRTVDTNGVEDSNQNKVGKFTYNLVRKFNDTGKNWISIQLNTSLKTAKDIFNSVGNNASAISRINPATQTSQSFINVNGGIGVNFSIVQEEGYELHIAGNTIWTIVGKPYASSPQKAFVAGSNFIGLPLASSLSNANSVLSSIGSKALFVQRMDTVTQTIVQWNGTGTNFAINNGEGYKIQISEATVWNPV